MFAAIHMVGIVAEWLVQYSRLHWKLTGNVLGARGLTLSPRDKSGGTKLQPTRVQARVEPCYALSQSLTHALFYLFDPKG